MGEKRVSSLKSSSSLQLSYPLNCLSRFTTLLRHLTSLRFTPLSLPLVPSLLPYFSLNK